MSACSDLMCASICCLLSMPACCSSCGRSCCATLAARLALNSLLLVVMCSCSSALVSSKALVKRSNSVYRFAPILLDMCKRRLLILQSMSSTTPGTVCAFCVLQFLLTFTVLQYSHACHIAVVECHTTCESCMYRPSAHTGVQVCRCSRCCTEYVA